jgi:hypothetical protein
MRASMIALLLMPAIAFAIDRPDPPTQNPLGRTSDFLLYHPDQSHRYDGLQAYQDGNYEYALHAFRAASRFADKPAQAMLASMYWEGRGVGQDRALGYVWMDLAAERGYPWLVATRERYWNAMNEDERQHALAIGPSIFDEYGDAAALPRLNVWMHRGRMQVAGSHAGFLGAVEIHRQFGNYGGFDAGFDAGTYFAARYWNQPDYLAWQNSAWHPESTGNVNVGALESVRAAPTPAQPPDPAPDAKAGGEPVDPDRH